MTGLSAPLQPGESDSGKLGPGPDTIADQTVRMLLGQAGAPTAETALAAAGQLSHGDLQSALGNVALTAAGIAPMFAGPIRGFHGTPHTFEPVEGNPFGEFRDDAIGSGEGAQAYGWGHYVAGNPAVAKGYQNDLSQSQLTLDGKPFDFSNLQHPGHYAMGVVDQFPDAEQALSHLNETLPSVTDPSEKGILSEARNWLQQNQNNIGRNQGHLLEVHILPEESALLDWDKPLSGQSPEVQEKLQQLSNKTSFIDPDSYFTKSINLNHNGEVIYRNLGSDTTLLDTSKALFPDKDQYYGMGAGGDEMASAALHSAGIPGIKYLDAGSRNGPDIPRLQQQLLDYTEQVRNPDPVGVADFGREGYVAEMQKQVNSINAELEKAKNWKPTSNYVIFHPSNLRIVGRNGERLTPVDHDPFAPESQ